MALAASAPPGPPGGRRHRQLRAAVVVVAACLAACLPLPAAAAAPKANSIPSTNAIAFLRQFGYLEGSRPPGWDGAVDVGDRFGTTNATTMGRPDSETLYTEEAVVTAIKLVQKFGAIPQTGVIDEATDKLMKARRCGCPDVVRHAPDVRGHTHRHKRFVVASKGWKRRHIKYYIANWTPKIGEDGVHALMVRAFDAWSAYGRLRFTRAAQPSEADITIAFGRGNHGDWFPFDGPGGILAHAFYPYEMATYGGDIHFDDDEQWAADPNATQLYDGAVDLFLVAVHEMGHSLGLGHSPDPQSIMFPYYQSKSESFKLGQDDIMGMYELYIKRQLEEDNDTPTYEENHRPAPPPNTTPRPPRTTTTRTTTTRTTTTRTTTPRRPRPPPRPRPTTTTTTTPRPRRPPTPPPSRPPPHRPPPPTSAPTYHGDDETVEEHKKHDHKHGIPPGPAGPFGPSDAGPGGGSDNGGGHSHGHGGGHGGSHGGSGHSGSGHSGSGHGGSGHSGSGHGGGHSGVGDSEENVIPDLCDGHYDAVAQLRGELFAFKGQYLWRFRQPGEVMQGYPVPLRRMFRDLPEQVTRMDAVYQREDGNIVLFSGHRYWVYNGVSFVENSPQSITRLGLPSSIDCIDAVMIWAKNKATYFFRGSDFWRYNTTTSRMDPGYPKRISKSWKQAPNEIDDAMTWTDGVSHFFKGDLSYQIDNAHVTVARTYRTAQIWFGCR